MAEGKPSTESLHCNTVLTTNLDGYCVTNQSQIDDQNIMLQGSQFQTRLEPEYG